MPSPAAEEARTLDDAELAQAINDAYHERFNLQFQKGTRQLQDSMAIRRVGRQIARLRTVQRERQLAIAAGAPIEPLTEQTETVISPQKRRAQEERAEIEAAEAKAEAEASAAEEAAAETAVADDALESAAADAAAATTDEESDSSDGDATETDPSDQAEDQADQPEDQKETE